MDSSYLRLQAAPGQVRSARGQTRAQPRQVAPAGCFGWARSVCTGAGSRCTDAGSGNPACVSPHGSRPPARKRPSRSRPPPAGRPPHSSALRLSAYPPIRPSGSPPIQTSGSPPIRPSDSLTLRTSEPLPLWISGPPRIRPVPSWDRRPMRAAAWVSRSCPRSSRSARCSPAASAAAVWHVRASG